MNGGDKMKVLKKSLVFVLVLTMAFQVGIVNNIVETRAEGYGIKNPRISNDTATWDCVYFGSYPQSSDGKGGFKVEPIKWRVLSVNGNDAFLVSDRVLDMKGPWDLHAQPQPNEVTWENYCIRTWLNDEFYNTAFNVAEKNSVKTSTVVNKDNEVYGISGGNTTYDKVYLLSADEVTNQAYGFLPRYNIPECGKFYEFTNWTRTAVATDYAISRHVIVKSYEEYCGGPDTNNVSPYWLRTPSTCRHTSFMWDDGLCVNYDGGTGESSYYSESEWYGGSEDGSGNEFCFGIRPVIHIDLSYNYWSGAGTYSSSTLTKKQVAEINAKLGINTSSDKDGTKTVNDEALTIIKSKSSIKGVESRKKSLKIKWKKVSGVTGYIIQYSLKKNFKKAKSLRIKKASKNSTTIKKLKRKKKYYIRIRTYKIVNGKTYKSSWSKTKSIKTK